jgi:hypothetical protein
VTKLAAHSAICWAVMTVATKVGGKVSSMAGRMVSRRVASKVAEMLAGKLAATMVGKLAMLSAASLALSKVAWRAAHWEICWAARMASTKVVVMGAVSAWRTDEKMVG